MITTLSATAADVPGWLLLPFVLMLLTIALAPVLFERFWEENRNKLIVALAIGIPTAGILFYRGLGENLVHTMLIDYIPFIILLGGLFAVTGGIRITGDLRANPAVNTAFLGIGAILASIMGTTGAAMLLIRPLMETNAERKHKTHTILFFIAAVANCGGILTPLGDPPLFLLYLRGAHFSWFLHMLPEWATINAILLLVYYLMDCRSYKRESLADLRKDRTERTALKVSGTINFLWLLGIVLAVAFVNEQYIPSMGGEGNNREVLPRIRYRAHDRAFAPHHPQGAPGSEQVHVAPHTGSGVPLHRNIHHDDSRAAVPHAARPYIRPNLTQTLFLRHGGTVGIPRQCSYRASFLLRGAGSP